MVTSAKDAVTGRVSGAKDSVSGTLSGVVQKTRGAVQDSVEKTKAVVSGGVNTMLESRVMQLVSSGVDTALSTSENLVEHYLPVTEEEIGESHKKTSVFALFFPLKPKMLRVVSSFASRCYKKQAACLYILLSFPKKTII